MDATREALSQFSAGMLSVENVHSALCQDILNHVSSTRASIWYFDAGGRSMTSACVVDRRLTQAEPPITLLTENCAPYIDEIRRKGSIAASNALTDDVTSCLAQDYLIPLGITSLLDQVIAVGADPVAVLCCEHCGEFKDWSNQDQAYLQSMAILLRLSFVMQNVANRRQTV